MRQEEREREEKGEPGDGGAGGGGMESGGGRKKSGAGGIAFAKQDSKAIVPLGKDRKEKADPIP